MAKSAHLNVVLQENLEFGSRLITAQEGSVVWETKSTFAARAMFYAMNSIATSESEMQMQRIMMAIENALLPPPVHRREPVINRLVTDRRDVVHRSI